MKMSREKKIERFNRKYEKKGGFAKFQEMVNNFATLEEIGHYFGFSRQNAAGIFSSLFGGKYRIIQAQRREKLHANRITKLQNLDERLAKLQEAGKLRSAKKTFYLKLVKQEAERQNLKVEFPSTKTFSPKLKINGYLVSIAGTNAQTIYHQPQNGKPTIYYRFAVSSKNHDFSIFVLDQGNDQYTYYIIPYDKIKHLSLVTLRTSYENPRRKGKNGSKYAQYRNAWYLLAPSTQTRNAN
jgi:RNA binding exosome subunit